LALYIPNGFVDNSSPMDELRSKIWSSPLSYYDNIPREFKHCSHR